MSLDGKHVLITGGNGGIGRHVVERLLEAGARVTVADRTPEGRRPGAAFVEADLSSPDAVYRLGESLRAAPPDILVNLAGLNAFNSFESMERAQLATLMQVNLLAPMQLTHCLLPGMIARGSGQIVNIGSVLGDIPLPYFTAYAASKAGVGAFSESLRRELTGRGVTVTHIAPRAVSTPMNHGAIGEFNKRSGAAEDPPERVAAIIVDAIARNRRRVTIGLPERFFIKVNQLLPSLVDHSIRRNRKVAEDVLSQSVG